MLMEHVGRDKLDSRELITDMIDKAPTADAVPVVRCKDCKHYDGESKMCLNKNIGMYGDEPSLDWYCADGERRKKDD